MKRIAQLAVTVLALFATFASADSASGPSSDAPGIQKAMPAWIK